MDRRSFLRRASSAIGAAALPFTALNARVASQSPPVRRGQTAGYGPLFPVADETTGLPLITLPRGFSYLTFGWTGDPLASGGPTPGSHDGMAAFPAGSGLTRIVRNHERGTGTPFGAGDLTYDPLAAGGTTTLLFDTHDGALISAHASISGTIRNCAGGATPWGTWLTCEETFDHTGMPHGYIFEVPADGSADPTPLRAMGRFSHEALAVDPATGASARGGKPAAVSAWRSSSGVVSALRRTAWTDVPNRLVFSTAGCASSQLIVATGSAARTSRIGRSRKAALSSAVVPSAASRPACMIATRSHRSASSR